MTDINIEMADTLMQYVEETGKARDAVVSKVASLQNQNEALSKAVVSVDTLKTLVSKLAGAGVIDKFNEAYFHKNASETNTHQCIQRLIGLLEEEGDAQAKEASAPSPFKVEKPGNKAVRDQADIDFSRQLRELVRRN